MHQINQESDHSDSTKHKTFTQFLELSIYSALVFMI